MSQQSVEIAKRAIEAFNGEDVAAFVALTTMDFEWYPSMTAIEGQVFRGHAGAETYFANLSDAWETFQILPGRFCEHVAGVAMLGALTGRGKASGATVDSPLGMVFDFCGLISRIRGKNSARTSRTMFVRRSENAQRQKSPTAHEPSENRSSPVNGVTAFGLSQSGSARSGVASSDIVHSVSRGLRVCSAG